MSERQKRAYDRPHLSFDAQLQMLKERGLTITDDAAALSYLKRLGYYRLSAYWYSFRKPDVRNDRGRVISRANEFEPGTTFQAAVELYVFDKKLRLLIMDAIERIEVALRVDVAHTLGKRSSIAHTLPDQFRGSFSTHTQVRRGSKGPATTFHQDWLHKLDQAIDRSSEMFKTHYAKTYIPPMPIWVVIELWDFGLLSRLFEGMLLADQSAIADRLGIPDPRLLTSWLKSLNFLRNTAAHHSRMFNRNMVSAPEPPKAGQIEMFDPMIADFNKYRPYAGLCVVAYLMKQVCPQSGWCNRLADHLRGFPTVPGIALDVGSMGCPPGWEAHPFWV